MMHIFQTIAQHADELRRAAHQAHVDRRSRRSAELNRAAARLEEQLRTRRQPGLTQDQFERLQAQLRGERPWSR